ncbi:hypothetical protein [Phytoactinopolyspora mesophila]|uniref:Sigma-70 family RNA polymerase sigma factor n=1 Tax=Phytoactinopolyspora mesophila TaxID=2650750 RepID=A0A7K3MCU3_9ACTN|nr:hypothetical protein [Phytoactinopolyspora mesophila]NDL60218.1 hypothetical protein [Phytoactinopolyspora mesophila]
MRADSALGALIEAAQRDAAANDAGRTVLQILLGHAVRIAARAYRPGVAGICGDLSQLSASSVTGVWEVIRVYPVRRRSRRIAANVALDARRTFARTLHQANCAELPVEPAYLDVPVPEAALDAGVELLGVLAWGIDQRVITPSEAALLTRVYCPAPGEAGGAAVADQLGLPWPTVRQRCSRAVRRLASAVSAVGHCA